ncbi:MAG TPA: HAMP domain-containing sensor histidine kinase [Steroidobacteraceae bacterium]|jgi:signal transduction histidine kinase|nr:HAMP domain-containing sensor histidine kinase [Steroidobacteraceae bacterium]
MRSSALSLALGYVALGIAALVLFAAPLWYAWQVTVQDGRAEYLQSDAQRLTDVFRRDGAEGLKTFIDTRVQMQIPNERYLLLADASMHPLAGNLRAWPATVPAEPGNYTIKFNVGNQGVQTVLVHVALLGAGYNLLVGRDNALFAPLQTHFWYGLAGAVAVLSIAGLLIGLITRRALMSRVHSIRQTVSAIMHGDLKHRLPTQIYDDELNTLTRTINGMLEQIELLVHGVRNVSNSIAHDLRTPLAELRSRLEELALIRPPAEQTFAEIDGAVADVDRVIRIFDALLRLAEIDAGMRRSGFVTLDAAEVAANAVEFYAPAAELKNIELALRSDGPAAVSGDPILLAQALGNLLDNALKYAPVNGTIEVAVRKRVDSTAEISVSDNGPGIADSEKSKVVERFYRGDASRGTPGVGLGLSVVQAVAKLHGTALSLSDRKPGLRAAIILPLDPAGGTESAPKPQHAENAASIGRATATVS